MQGYLKVSVSVLGPGDKLPVHNEPQEVEQELVLMPPSICQAQSPRCLARWPQKVTMWLCTKGHYAAVWGGS